MINIKPSKAFQQAELDKYIDKHLNEVDTLEKKIDDKLAIIQNKGIVPEGKNLLQAIIDHYINQFIAIHNLTPEPSPERTPEPTPAGDDTKEKEANKKAQRQQDKKEADVIKKEQTDVTQEEVQSDDSQAEGVQTEEQEEGDGQSKITDEKQGGNQSELDQEEREIIKIWAQHLEQYEGDISIHKVKQIHKNTWEFIKRRFTDRYYSRFYEKPFALDTYISKKQLSFIKVEALESLDTEKRIMEYLKKNGVNYEKHHDKLSAEAQEYVLDLMNRCKTRKDAINSKDNDNSNLIMELIKKNCVERDDIKDLIAEHYKVWKSLFDKERTRIVTHLEKNNGNPDNDTNKMIEIFKSNCINFYPTDFKRWCDEELKERIQSNIQKYLNDIPKLKEDMHKLFMKDMYRGSYSELKVMRAELLQYGKDNKDSEEATPTAIEKPSAKLSEREISDCRNMETVAQQYIKSNRKQYTKKEHLIEIGKRVVKSNFQTEKIKEVSTTLKKLFGGFKGPDMEQKLNELYYPIEKEIQETLDKYFEDPCNNLPNSSKSLPANIQKEYVLKSEELEKKISAGWNEIINSNTTPRTIVQEYNDYCMGIVKEHQKLDANLIDMIDNSLVYTMQYTDCEFEITGQIDKIIATHIAKFKKAYQGAERVKI